jgi:hypothetical protein
LRDRPNGRMALAHQRGGGSGQKGTASRRVAPSWVPGSRSVCRGKVWGSSPLRCLGNRRLAGELRAGTVKRGSLSTETTSSASTTAGLAAEGVPARGVRDRHLGPHRGSPRSCQFAGKKAAGSGGPCPLGAAMDSSAFFSHAKEGLPQRGHGLRPQISGGDRPASRGAPLGRQRRRLSLAHHPAKHHHAASGDHSGSKSATYGFVDRHHFCVFARDGGAAAMCGLAGARSGARVAAGSRYPARSEPARDRRRRRRAPPLRTR